MRFILFIVLLIAIYAAGFWFFRDPGRRARAAGFLKWHLLALFAILVIAIVVFNHSAGRPVF